MKTTYRKNSIEAKLDSLLPKYPSFDVIAHELQHDGQGYSTNDSWHLARGCDRESAISHLVNRWHVFKANYAPKARVRDLSDANWSGDEFPALLEVDCIPFAEVRNGKPDEKAETSEPRFSVIEYASYFAVRDNQTGEEAAMCDGVDTLSDENGKTLSPGTEGFIEAWEASLNSNPSETAEAYFSR